MIRLPRCGGYWLAFTVATVLAGTPDPARADDPVHWRGDYTAARKEAREKGLPLLVEIGTDACVFCRKQDATTFRDPIITRLLNRRFVPLRVDGNKCPEFVDAMRVTKYPTTVLAAPDGTILVYHSGYLSPDELKQHLQRAQPPITAD